MTKEQFEKAKKYEQPFRWAIHSNFIHLSNGEFKEISDLYTEVYNDRLTPAQSNCNACRLKALQRLGNDYFALKEKYEKEAQEKAPAEDAQKPVEENKTSKPTATTTKTVKKAGRPKKIDLNA